MRGEHEGSNLREAIVLKIFIKRCISPPRYSLVGEIPQSYRRDRASITCSLAPSARDPSSAPFRAFEFARRNCAAALKCGREQLGDEVSEGKSASDRDCHARSDQLRRPGKEGAKKDRAT